MESALGWIGELVQWLAAWIPRIAHVDVRHRGVRFVRGKEPKLVLPGLTLFWPIMTEMIVWPVITQTLRLRSQSLRTLDHQTIELEILVTYQISDIVALFGELHNPESGISDLCLGAARKVVCTTSLIALEQDVEQTDRQLLDEIRKQVNTLGVRIKRARFVSLVPSRAVKHFGLPQPAEADGSER